MDERRAVAWGIVVLVVTPVLTGGALGAVALLAARAVGIWQP